MDLHGKPVLAHSFGKIRNTKINYGVKEENMKQSDVGHTHTHNHHRKSGTRLHKLKRVRGVVQMGIKDAASKGVFYLVMCS